KFLDYLEANAETYWRAPKFRLGSPSPSADTTDSDEEEEDADRYESAYEGVVFRDSTDDGIEGSIFETDESSGDELVEESRRVADRLDFLSTVAVLWRRIAVSPAFRAVADLDPTSPERVQRIA